MADARRRRRAEATCLWCGRELGEQPTMGRRRQYCRQSCRQRAYENRTTMASAGLPEDAVLFTAGERQLLADKLFQVRCAAEDVATAVADGATGGELGALVDQLLATARDAEVLRD
ncbi:hypothetical protein HKD39_01735 [Nakamurella sp. DB0629]|uniref:FCS-type domain-containing protein n=1 Tax=Nakamurella aerolata TaxID=1656892 RepID=A0A849A615_9ACTN|nr:hypothetical protein [Nakamurella aerolata]